MPESFVFGGVFATDTDGHRPSGGADWFPNMERPAFPTHRASRLEIGHFGRGQGGAEGVGNGENVDDFLGDAPGHRGQKPARGQGYVVRTPSQNAEKVRPPGPDGEGKPTRKRGKGTKL